MTEPFLELSDISKIYPGVVALDHVSFAVSRGEVIGLIGENGAGKSTLMKVMGGVTEPSGGVIRIDGVERNVLTVGEAIRAGIAFVHQELNLFDNLDAAANVFIGREPLRFGPLRLIDRTKLHAAVKPLLDFVVGFVLAAGLVGWLAQRGADRHVLRTALMMVLGNLVIYAVGVPWLMQAAGMDLATALDKGVVPFLLGDGLKVLAAAGLLPAAWALVRRVERH